MPEVRQHGRPYQEPERHDELSAGVPGAIVQGDARDERTSSGQFCTGATAIQSAGGRARKGRTKLSHEITGEKLSSTSVRRARFLRRTLATEIASTVGGGTCGVAASLLIKFCAQKTAAAEEAYERGDFEAHRKLSESARMDLLYAREHAAKEAVARRAHTAPADPLAAFRRANSVVETRDDNDEDES